MGGGPRLVVATTLLVVANLLATTALRDGDFIATSRRAQFQQTRTQWHDLIEHHCPRFGVARTVALPITKPDHIKDTIKDYRIQLSFDGDRVTTPWITVIGKGLVGMPYVTVELRRVGGDIKGAKVKVAALPDEFLVSHSQMYDEFHNATHWPKHVLLRYEFNEDEDTDLEGGIYVLATLCLLCTVLMSFANLAGVQSKVAQFMKDVVGEDGPVVAPSVTDPLLGASSLQPQPAPYIVLKGGSHVE